MAQRRRLLLCRRLNWLCLAGLAAALGALAVRADYARADPGVDGRRDVMLCYASPKAWSVEQFRPYVAYLEPQSGAPREWFFDAWLLLQYGGAPSGADYISGPTTKSDWEHFLEAEWTSGRNLDALDTCIGQTAVVLGPPGRPQPVILMIPYPSAKQTAFGDLRGEGASADLSRPADRQRAVEWFVDEAIRRWQATPRRHLRLWGFYWMNEGISPPDHEIVKQTCAYVHAKGLKAYWIPWFRAAGFERWRELGFDVAVMQPNFAFTAPPAGLRLGDANRLSLNASLAREHGLGVEMELNDSVLTAPESRWNLRQYLNHGVPELDGYMAGVARAWYQSGDLVRRLAESGHPDCRQLYDDIFRFHRGRYAGRPASLAAGRPVTVESAEGAATVRLLTDGAWDTQGTRPELAVRLSAGSAKLTLDLGQLEAVSNLRFHLRDSAALGEIQVRTSRDALVWEPVEVTEILQEQAAAGPGFWLLSLPPTLARCLEIKLQWPSSATLELGEVIVPPDGNAFWECRPDVQERTVEWPCPEPRVLRQLRVGPFPPGVAGAATVRLGDRDIPAVASGSDGWAEWQLPPILAPCLTVTLPAGTPTAALGVLAVPAQNAAAQRPYRLTPDFPAKYPDSGRELADGAVSTDGFPDGRTVGWLNLAPSVTFDLGQEQPLERVRIHAQGGGYAAVSFPAAVELAAGDVGGTWRSLSPRSRSLVFTVPAEALDTRRLGWAECELGGVSARFLRLRFRPSQAGWTMLSEIEILSAGRNLAAAAPYVLQPLPSSESAYSDNHGYLTDGTYSASGWQGCAGWNEGTPEITVDLQRQLPITLIVVRLLGGGAGGVYFPERVDSSLSVDGTTWSAAGSASDRPAEGSAQERRAGALFIRFEPPQAARFVRLTIQRRGWAMLHEIEVY
jgi:hypothetical protein